MLVCFRCGHGNDPKENYCLGCGATLPKLAYTMDMGSGEVIMDLYEKFADAAALVSTGQISLDEFEDFLVKQNDKQKGMEQEIRDTEISEDIMEDFEEELEAGFTGIELVNEGIEIMAQFLDEQNQKYLDEGLDSIKQGMAYLNKAFILNRQRDKRQSHYADLMRRDNSMEL